MPSTTHFHDDIQALKERLLTMASHAELAVNRAMQALSLREDQPALNVKQDDSILDQLEIEIDDMAIHLLARAPLASDLRLITVAMKISHDLERVGDEATTIARRALAVNHAPPLRPPLQLATMEQAACRMLRLALDAFVNRDAAEARGIIPQDKAVDALNKEVVRDLTAAMTADPGAIPPSLHLIVISKCLERIADHATNIAEEVVYLQEGRDIRHSGKGQLASAP